MGANLNILDLPESIFRDIFQYLDYETIYSLKYVCQEVKYYVNGFLKLGGVFLVSTGRDVPNEFIYIFKQANKKPIIYSILGDPYPYPKGFRATDIGSFGANVDNKIVLGVYHGHIENFKLSLHQFIPSRNEWHSILPGTSKDSKYKNKGYATDLERKYGAYKGGPIISCCSIGNSAMMLFYGGQPNQKNTAQLLRLYYSKIKKRNEYALSNIDIPPALTSLKEFTFIGITKDSKVMLIGGVHYLGSLVVKGNSSLWEGTLSEDESSVIWEEIPLNVINLRRRPVCFILDKNLYIAGGHDKCLKDQEEPDTGKQLKNKFISKFTEEAHICSCCDRYNIIEGKYYENVYTFPSGSMTSRHISNIATDEEEQFAVIAPYRCETSTNQKIIMFTEAEGFVEVPNFLSKRGQNVEWNHPRLQGHSNVLLRI